MAILRGTRNFIVRSSTFHHQAYYPPTCKTNFGYLGFKTIDLNFLMNRFRVQCYSSRMSSTAKTSRSRKLTNEPVMEQVKYEFFVVLKGDIVGVYKSFWCRFESAELRNGSVWSMVAAVDTTNTNPFIKSVYSEHGVVFRLLFRL